jgi:hypothetical protein
LVLGEEFLKRFLGLSFLRQNTLGGHFPNVGGSEINTVAKSVLQLGQFDPLGINGDNAYMPSPLPRQVDGACSLVHLHHQRPSLCNSQVGSCNYFCRVEETALCFRLSLALSAVSGFVRD